MLATCSDRLRNFKDRTGMTNEQLAEKFDVGPVTVSRWLTGTCNMDSFHQEWLVRFEAEFLMGEDSPLSPAAQKQFTKGYRRGARA